MADPQPSEPGLPPPRAFRFPRSRRITRTTEFDRVMRQGLRLADGLLAVWALRNDLGHCRLGLVVGRRHGNAVHRHRLKRCIREAFRLSQHDLPPGLDLVVSPQPGVDLTLEKCRASLATLADRLARRL